MAASITFVLAGWDLPSPGQQLLDRFLAGYPHQGTHHRPEVRVTLCPVGIADPTPLEQRAASLGLTIEPDLTTALERAEGIVTAWIPPGHEPDDALLLRILAQAPRAARCFVLGPLCHAGQTANSLQHLTRELSLEVVAGSPLNVTWRLPAIDIEPGTALREALAVVQGPFGMAEWDALESLVPLLQQRAGGESGIDQIRKLEGDEVWEAGEKGAWSRDLLAAALSRSDSPQGDPVRDGRTQDLVGLGLVPGLARNPRGWLLRHRDGLRTSLLVLDGVVSDYNVAVATRDGGVKSMQIFQAPRPAQHEYSRLAHAVEGFLLGGQPPWSMERSLWIASTLRRMRGTA